MGSKNNAKGDYVTDTELRDVNLPQEDKRNSYLRCTAAFPKSLVGARGREVVQTFRWALIRAHVSGAVVSIVLIPKSLCGHGSCGGRVRAKTSRGWGL